jgi:putative tricarboxylic transport membrane protein
MGGQMRKEDLVVAAICLITSVVVLSDSAHRYFGDQGEMGPGAFPTLLAILIGLCGVSIIVQWMRGNRDTRGPAFISSGVGGWRFSFVAGSLVIHRFVMDFVGFGLTSLVLMIFQMRLLGRHRWSTTLILSVLFVLLISVTFRVWLYMGLPRGFIGF